MTLFWIVLAIGIVSMVMFNAQRKACDHGRLGTYASVAGVCAFMAAASSMPAIPRPTLELLVPLAGFVAMFAAIIAGATATSSMMSPKMRKATHAITSVLFYVLMLYMAVSHAHLLR